MNPDDYLQQFGHVRLKLDSWTQTPAPTVGELVELVVRQTQQRIVAEKLARDALIEEHRQRIEALEARLAKARKPTPPEATDGA